MSTFHGLEMSKRALAAQQAGLYTTGNNLSNANTQGYTRQRVNFESTSPFPPASMNRPQIPGQMGTGVKVGTVERIRDKFLDQQFRSENSRVGYWGTRANSLSRMEGLMNEMDDEGISKSLDEFSAALQELSKNPENAGTRSVVARKGEAVAEVFNYISNSLENIRTDLKEQIGGEVGAQDNGIIGHANSLLTQINDINEQIKGIEPHGYLANDLYDQRDRLIDELSSIVNIKVEYEKTSDSSLKIADGIAKIELVDKTGKPFADPVILLGKNDVVGKFEVEYGSINGQDAVTGIKYKGKDVPFKNVDGSLKALVESYGYTDNGTVKGDFPEVLAKLDKMVSEFAKAFNDVHVKGKDTNNSDGKDFFVSKDGIVPITAKNIKVNQTILDDPGLIAASSTGETGNGDNALALEKVIKNGIGEPTDNTNGLQGASVKTFYQGVIGSLAVDKQKADGMNKSTGIQRKEVENRRMSVSSVSLDEEMINLVKFQHAYNAAARNMTTADELLDRIINNMGLVGR